MVLDKKAISLLFNQETVGLMSKWYKIDCPNRERSFSSWVDNMVKMSLQEREFLE